MIPENRPRARRIVLLVVWGLSALYAFHNLDRGWIPHDEGTLAQSAERVLDGELPHRDFDELYTGGLSAMNAVAFEALGVNLLTPRLVLFAFFLLWVPALVYVVSRFATLPVTALATLLAVSWSIPNYPAAMPSWYNLFFATFGLAALLRFLEKPRGRWLFAAGLAGGLSILVKTSGLFFVAAGLLFLAYREQETSTGRADGDRSAPRGRTPGFSIFSSLLLALFIALLSLLVVSAGEGPAAILQFVVPLGGVAVFLVWTEWTGVGRRAGSRRMRALARLGLPFIVGVLVPVSGLVLVYAAHGALEDLARGLFQTPMRRLAFAATPSRGIASYWVALPLVGLVLFDALPLPRKAQVGAAAILLVGAAGLTAVPIFAHPSPAMPAWYVLKALPPLTAVAGAVVLVIEQLGVGNTLGRQRILAVLAVSGAVSLVQFPFSGPLYLFYALPVIVPTALSLVDPRRKVSPASRPVSVAAMALLLLVTIRWVNSGALYREGHFPYDPASATARLSLPRGGGLRVSPEQKKEYEELVGALWAFSKSRYTFATPDVPEVYFLSGLRNPTRTIFDFFDEGPGRTDRILSALDEHHVNVVVLNRVLRFSGPPDDALLSALEARYPRAAKIGDFLLLVEDGTAGTGDGSE